jgi:hypothetical protein
MATDKSYFWYIFERLLKFLKLGNDMNAVNAAGGPEIYDNKLSLQVMVKAQLCTIFSIQPIQWTFELITRGEIEALRLFSVSLSVLHN